jgi:hypothetical protein
MDNIMACIRSSVGRRYHCTTSVQLNLFPAKILLPYEAITATMLLLVATQSSSGPSSATVPLSGPTPTMRRSWPMPEPARTNTDKPTRGVACQVSQRKWMIVVAVGAVTLSCLSTTAVPLSPPAAATVGGQRLPLYPVLLGPFTVGRTRQSIARERAPPSARVPVRIVARD